MQLRTLLAQPRAPTDTDHSLERVFYAINVTDDEKKQFEERFAVELINGYGLSEAMTLVTMAPVFGDRRWPSIGLPLYDRTVRVLDADGAALPAGEIGEIAVRGVRGRTLFKEYYKDPGATAAALTDGWLHTGATARSTARSFLPTASGQDVIKRATGRTSFRPPSDVIDMLVVQRGRIGRLPSSVSQSDSLTSRETSSCCCRRKRSRRKQTRPVLAREPRRAQGADRLRVPESLPNILGPATHGRRHCTVSWGLYCYPGHLGP